MMTALMAFLCVAGLALSAPEQDALTISGTPDGVTVREPGGAVEHVSPGQLQLMNRERVSPAPASAEEAAPEVIEASKGGEAQPPAETAPEAPVPPEPEVKELTPEQLAKKKAAIAEIQAVGKLGGAYFYTEDNRPISSMELHRMLESDEVPNIKVVDLFQQRRLYDFRAIEADDEAE